MKDVIIANNMFVHLPETYSGHYSIPENISQIIGGAFYNCKGLTSVTIPNSVTSIGFRTFEGCTDLTSVTIPNSVASISYETFSGCSGLTSVTIPNSVTHIGSAAFRSCSNLENVYCYAEKFSKLENYIFKDSYIESATLHVPSSALSYYQTTEPWSGFGTIKALGGTEPETKKCEKPVISYANGELDFTCSTEGVEFASEIKCKDVKKFNTSKVSLSACYDISVTATKAGYDNSDVATAKLYWLPTSDIGTNINTAKTRGVVIQSAGGFITLSGLDTNERVDFFAIDGAALGSATATDGTVTFSTKSGTIVVAKIGKESVKIAVE
ncbi:MAG: leucine-rich repeat domain-containing protein [Prevotella sp.]|nr:leucine-rich repeat domain-containing protein [Prevotella sp.]